jgi:hypothetical protein
MLRVMTEPNGNGWLLALHGTLGGDWVQVVEEEWRALAAERPGAPVLVVLSQVDFIDADGERLLQRMAEAGVAFVVSGCLNRYVIEQVRRHAPAAQGAGR